MRKKLNPEEMEKISGGNTDDSQRVLDQINLKKFDRGGRASVLKPVDSEVKISELLPSSEQV